MLFSSRFFFQGIQSGWKSICLVINLAFGLSKVPNWLSSPVEYQRCWPCPRFMPKCFSLTSSTLYSSNTVQNCSNAPFCFGLDIFPTWNGSPSLCIWKAPIYPLKPSCHLFQDISCPHRSSTKISILATSMHKIAWIHLTHSNTFAYISVSPVRLCISLTDFNPSTLLVL